MKPLTRILSVISSVLLLVATTFVADARWINARSYEELEKSADLIVVAKPLATQDTAEETILQGIRPDLHVIGLSSDFAAIAVLKGDDNLKMKKLVLHHYRLANPNKMMVNGPSLASFDPMQSTRYLLFLQREPDGRYAPFDQVDPVWTSILQLSGTAWDKMTRDDFKDWMDAKRWLRERPKPGSEISPEITPVGRAEGSLHEAAMNGKLEKAKVLLKTNPALVFSQASYGNLTPLQFAAQYGHIDMAKLLLANGAEVEAKSYGGWTTLLHAVFGGHKDMVELLLTNKANVNYQESSGRTPLHVAAENGYTEIAALLLANKADVNAKNHDGYTPMHVAAMRGDKDMVELLLAHKAEYNIQDAAAIGDLARVKAILKDNPDLVSSKDFSGSTALHWAVSQGHADIVELLLANKANADARRDKTGWTPLRMAVLSGHKDVVELLLAGKADVNGLCDGQTPLRFAESLARQDIAELLRQHGGHE